MTPPTASREQLRRLHVDSGLTWEQLAKLFGVSRHAVHMWVIGEGMNAANHAQLARLITIIYALPGDTPAQRREAILAPHTGAYSRFDLIQAEHGYAGQPVPRAPWRIGNPAA